MFGKQNCPDVGAGRFAEGIRTFKRRVRDWGSFSSRDAGCTVNRVLQKGGKRGGGKQGALGARA